MPLVLLGFELCRHVHGVPDERLHFEYLLEPPLASPGAKVLALCTHESQDGFPTDKAGSSRLLVLM
eukprot:CAMPEP_0172786506 /NCGR_PEP_ID=MMETSP1074-20121228/205984_1 /TAXON_ID=2916 /ORGANISM="Ceratium fusus, Strain PA161109" /LENGTH=65 /DNA_ID=CAMNT_0013623521 /DNA_START=801 /DNA_END=998 /DNA_ORIENTATION=-